MPEILINTEMSKELKDQLCFYLGELLCEADNTFDCMEKEIVLQKIDAIYLLLGVQPKQKRLSWIEKVMDAVKNIKQVEWLLK